MEEAWLFELIYFSILIPILSILITILYFKLIFFIHKQESKINLQMIKTKGKTLKNSLIILTFLYTIIWLPLGISGCNFFFYFKFKIYFKFYLGRLCFNYFESKN